MSIDSIKIYLVAEGVVNDDDMVRLKVTPQHSNSDVMMNLRDIVRKKQVLDKFLKALKRSFTEENNPGHEELFEMINKERERRLSVISRSREGDMPNPEINDVVESDGNCTESKPNNQESGDVDDELDNVIATQNSQTKDCVMDMDNDAEVDSAVTALTQRLHRKAVSRLTTYTNSLHTNYVHVQH